MFRQTVFPNIPRTVLVGRLGNLFLAGTSPLFASWLLKLYKAGPGAPDPAIISPSAFTECDFTGYASVDQYAAFGTSPQVNNPSGTGISLIANALFTAGAITGPGQNALGYYVTDTAGTNLLMWEVFAVPATFSLAGDFLDLDVMVPENFLQNV